MGSDWALAPGVPLGVRPEATGLLTYFFLLSPTPGNAATLTRKRSVVGPTAEAPYVPCCDV